MYLCICNAVTERDVANLVDQGVTSLGELRSRLRVADGCGGCRDDAEQFLRRQACSRGTNATAQLAGR
ncbi:MAG: (2Fe-2S)-binding protein [Gammaproteobacteria bacterium]|nr:(2Fe-2S)-binding protein [Gammaproteobacteria bacterium]